MNGNTKAYVLALLGVLLISAGLVGGIVVSGKALDANSTPMITTVLGFFSVATLALVSAINGAKNADTANRTEKKVDKVLNGHMDDKIKTAVRVVLNERERAYDRGAIAGRRATDNPDPSPPGDTVTKP